MTRISALKYGVAAVWLLALSTAEAATYTFESLTSANSSIAQPTILLPTINNKGAVAYYDRRIGGFVGGIVIDTGNSSVVHILNSPASPFEAGRGMPINDLGAVLVMRRTAASSGSGFNTLQRINADGTTTTLATFAADGSEDLKANNSNSVYGAFNNAGQAAFEATANDDTFQIVRISSDGSAITIIDTAGSSIPPSTDRFNFTQPALNDAGLVAYKASTLADGTDAYVGDGSSVQKAIELPTEGNTSASVGINNDGLVAAQTPSSLLTGKDAGLATEVRNVIIDGSTSGLSPFLNFAAVNNFDQTAIITQGISPNHSILIDGETILQTGDMLLGAPISLGPNSIRYAGDAAFNDFGQMVFRVQTDQAGPSGAVTTHLVRADPLGFSPDNPILPDRNPAPGVNEIDLSIVNALGVDAPIFVDPIIATGFTYSIGAGGANFASLLIPDALPGGDTDFTVEFGAFSETLLAGQTFNFTDFLLGGIGMFSILGIDIGEMIDPSEPFVVGLTFVNGGFSSVLSIEAIPFDTGPAAVPLPAAMPLFGTGLAVMGFIGWRRKRMTAAAA